MGPFVTISNDTVRTSDDCHFHLLVLSHSIVEGVRKISGLSLSTRCAFKVRSRIVSSLSWWRIVREDHGRISSLSHESMWAEG